MTGLTLAVRRTPVGLLVGTQCVAGLGVAVAAVGGFTARLDTLGIATNFTFDA